MTTSGLLISFDGLDSSGKATQAKHLAQRLRHSGFPVREFTSPDYSTATGKQLKKLLRDTRKWHGITWQEKMKLFAANRLEHRLAVKQSLTIEEIVVYDRYVPSSLAFIAVEALVAQEVDLFRQKIHQAVERLEYSRNNMPREDVSIFLDVPPLIADTLLTGRKSRDQSAEEYTDHLHVQERLYNEYDWLCREHPDHYLRIRCVEDNELLPIDDIAELVWERLNQRIPQLRRKTGNEQ